MTEAKNAFAEKERITAAIIGGAIGDALGVPVEFEERDSFTVTDMIGGGTHKQPAGTWPDDTVLTLCLIEKTNSPITSA
ncbi:ADP-ribosylglycohydrolase [Fibrobacteria bacterium R8-3-H12]